MTVLGFWVTVAAAVLAGVATVQYARATSRKALLPQAQTLLLVSISSVVVASIVLLALILRHDYSNGYVFSYSSTALPLHFLLSSFYAGQEGSFLFWALCSAVIALLLIRTGAATRTDAHLLSVYSGVFALLLLLLVVKSPFRSVWEMFPGMAAGEVPPDGRGLNPLLQNFWMVLHPPVLFVGFAAMAVPYSFALAGLWKREYNLVSRAGFSWTLMATLVLGVGIMLGAYWAYGVLGWGGYWGWDPVENSSLVPWIVGVALIHTMAAGRRTGGYVRSNILLAIAGYVLVVYSTFLTRSGILGEASVHSFTDPGSTVYALLVGCLLALIGAGVGFALLRRKDLRPAERTPFVLSREMMLGLGALLLLLTAAVVLFGTSLPILDARTVEPSFYDRTTLPLGIGMVLLIGLSLYTQWGIGDTRGMLRRSLRAAVVGVLAAVVPAVAGTRDPGILLFVFAAGFALAVNLELAWLGRKGSPLALGGKLAHAGIAVFFFGVAATGRFSIEQDLALELNTPQEALGYTFTYTGNRPTPDGKYIFDVVVEKEGVRTAALEPVMFHAGEQGIMRNPDIDEAPVRDVYVSPVSLEEARHADAGHAYTLEKGQTVSFGAVQATFVRFDMGAHGMDAGQGSMAVGSVLELTNGTERETVVPVAVYTPNGQPDYTPAVSRLTGGEVRLVAMNVGMGGGPSSITVEILGNDGHDHGDARGETLVVQASVKPLVSLLWGGSIVMFIGFLLSFMRRTRE
jgi:cytochrome c-type biogenesis protein CcmF